MGETCQFTNAPKPQSLRGVHIWSGLLAPRLQQALVAAVREVVQVAPLFRPETSRGQKMSVRMTSAGRFGWVSDRRGYRYEPLHPSGVRWPDIPQIARDVWRFVVPDAREPDSCLINFYDARAKMGLHQDRDEVDLDQPVVSVSLGDEALFRLGNLERGGTTQSIWLKSGDVVVLKGPSRLIHHGIDRTRPGSSRLLPKGGRINLTLRVAR